MSSSLHLTVTTPFELLVDTDDACAVRAEDASGGFGILPGHAELLTVLPASIMSWRDREDRRHYCAVKSGVLAVTGGSKVSIACRQAILGDDLEALAGRVRVFEAEQADAERQARTADMRMHARAVRELVSLLGLGGTRRQGDDAP